LLWPGLWLALSSLVTPPCTAQLLEEQFQLPVRVLDRHGKAVAQNIVVTTFFDDSTPSPRPLLVLNHGRAPSPQGRAALGRSRYPEASAWLARLGFVVALPTRVGYGVSAGPDVEASGLCAQRHYAPVFAAAAEQSLSVLAAMRQRPGVAPDRAVFMGQSFGGLTTLALAARQPAGVQAFINFSGGGGGHPSAHPQQPCSPAPLQALFASYGQSARQPSLWLYAQNDEYFGPTLPRQWFEAYRAQGGPGEFVQLPPVGEPNGGHALLSVAPALWQPLVLRFLRANGYPLLPEPGHDTPPPH
jgi:dienelactone hydrolase